MSTQWIQKWDVFWTRKGPPHLIAILRIIFGAYLMFYFATYNVPMLFSNVGLAMPYDLYVPDSLKFLLIPPDLSIAWLLYLCFQLSLLAFTFGYRTRLSATIAFLFFTYYILLSLHNYSTSYNRLFVFLLFLFTFSDAGNTFSFDMKRKRGSFLAWEPASVLTQRLIALQVSATYLGVGLQKVWLRDWQDGTLLLYTFQSMWATPFAFWVAGLNLPMQIFDAMNFIVKSFEIVLPFGLWSKKFRIWFMAGGVLFHIGISLFLAAIWWFYAMIACYLCFFEPEEVHEKLRSVRCDRIDM